MGIIDTVSFKPGEPCHINERFNQKRIYCFMNIPKRFQEDEKTEAMMMVGEMCEIKIGQAVAEATGWKSINSA